ncbi:MAG: DUF402 domain-containing protein [Chloroflexota bacterium]
MYPLIRVDKRIPDGSIWQSRRGYALPPVRGWSRVYQPAGTEWSNPLGGWTARTDGVSLFHPERQFTIACHGPADDKRYYIDIAHRVRVEPRLIEFFDLFLDVMIDASGVVTEKDEHQLILLPHDLRALVREWRDEVRRLISAGDALFDPRGPFYAVPDPATSLPPAIGRLALR